MKFKNLMLVPSKFCPANCAYCFGPNSRSSIMQFEILQRTIQWWHNHNNCKTEITFHGGEPLTAGISFYNNTLLLLRKAFTNQRFGIQSNLWLLTDDMCKLFSEYNVSIGTSIDGPEKINDSQRGKGYFKQVMAGIESARKYGLSVGAICTFTPQSVPFVKEITEFFSNEGLSFNVHASVLPLNSSNSTIHTWTLAPDVYGDLMLQLLDVYLANLERMSIPSLDNLCRSVTAREGSSCTFRNCLGSYLAVAPDGGIYPCQRFVGFPDFCLGNVKDNPDVEKLEQSPGWKLLKDREERVIEECGDCAHFDICKGGCPYDTLAANGGKFSTLRDPYCPAYKRIFDKITDKALEEVFSDDNLKEVVEDPKKGTLMRKGRLISLMRGDPHPSERTYQARIALASVALAAFNSTQEMIKRLRTLGTDVFPDYVISSIPALQKRLTTPIKSLNNLYLHITFSCPLHCSHCYTSDGFAGSKILSIDQIINAIIEAKELDFHKVIITGGEPLIYPEFEVLFNSLHEINKKVKPVKLVLRTSLAIPTEANMLSLISNSVDEIVISVDGDRDTHDLRRGKGSYDMMLNNLRILRKANPKTEISLAATMSFSEAIGVPGEAVRALAREVGINRVRFKPVLPLGRARGLQVKDMLSDSWQSLKHKEFIAYGFVPSATCGLGQNLYIEPDGIAYPCYAWHGKVRALGNIADDGGLSKVIRSHAFTSLCEHTVNTNERCRKCELRYLCGGACRAWTEAKGNDLDAPIINCESMHIRASLLLKNALDILGINKNMWLAAGLPLPNNPPPLGIIEDRS